MKNKIPILFLCLFVFISCAQKPMTVNIPMNIDDRVPFEKFNTIFIGGFDITTTISDPDPQKELIHFFTNDFQHAIKKKDRIYRY